MESETLVVACVIICILFVLIFFCERSNKLWNNMTSRGYRQDYMCGGKSHNVKTKHCSKVPDKNDASKIVATKWNATNEEYGPLSDITPMKAFRQDIALNKVAEDHILRKIETS